MKIYLHILSYIAQFFFECKKYGAKLVGNIKTHMFCAIFFFEIRAFNKIIFKSTVELCVIWRMCRACWIPKATHEQSQYVILIAFPLQQWLHASVSMLRYSTLPALLDIQKSHLVLVR